MEKLKKSTNKILKMNNFSTILRSKSFANFSTMYLKYLKHAGGFGLILGMGASVAHLMDCNKKNKREKAKIMYKRNIKDENLLTDDELDRCENSNLYNFSVVVGGPIVGVSVGVMWPAVVIFGPIYYVFGDYLAPIVASLLTISVSMVKENDKWDDGDTKDKKK